MSEAYYTIAYEDMDPELRRRVDEAKVSMTAFTEGNGSRPMYLAEVMEQLELEELKQGPEQ